MLCLMYAKGPFLEIQLLLKSLNTPADLLGATMPIHFLDFEVIVCSTRTILIATVQRA